VDSAKSKGTNGYIKMFTSVGDGSILMNAI